LNVELSLVGDNADEELRSLSRWLQADEDVRDVTFEMHTRSVRTGDMGPVPELIQAALQPGGLLAALAGVLGTWVTVKRRAVKLRIRSGDKEVEIDAAKMADPEAVAVRILRELDGASES
jgi:Effector Associated Constant Component 1